MNAKLPLCVAIAALLGACASPAPTPPELMSARTVVRSAEADPNVLNYAQLELKKATDALNRANELHAKRESLAEIASASYLAERHAETALAIARAKGNEEAIKLAQADRERARADAKTVEANRARAAAANARADAANARADASSALAQADMAQQQAGAAQRDADAAKAMAGDAERRAAELQAQTAAALSQADQARMQASLLQQKLIEIEAKQTERGMLVTLGDVLFEFGRAEIKPTAQQSLRKLADFLQQFPDRKLSIEGFTDSVGSHEANAVLSQRRAEAVASALIGMGVAPTRIVARGYGEDYPIAANTTDTNRALNRRVEVYISETSQPVRARG